MKGMWSCRYTQWRRKELANKMRKRPGRMLLGLLLPVVMGFAIAKTGFGSKRTAQALDDVSRSLHLPNIQVVSRHDTEPVHEVKDSEIPRIADSQSATNKNDLPPVDRKFLGIF